VKNRFHNLLSKCNVHRYAGDKSLLFDVELLGVKGEGGGTKGFRRGPGTWAEGVAGRLT
jgi:hypothetical protein